MKYRKKPVVIEALQWTGENEFEIMDFMNSEELRTLPHKGELYIFTLEGRMTASKFDYIIKGIKGEFYPCKPEIFNQTYEKVE